MESKEFFQRADATITEGMRGVLMTHREESVFYMCLCAALIGYTGTVRGYSATLAELEKMVEREVLAFKSGDQEYGSRRIV